MSRLASRVNLEQWLAHALHSDPATHLYLTEALVSPLGVVGPTGPHHTQANKCQSQSYIDRHTTHPHRERVYTQWCGAGGSWRGWLSWTLRLVVLVPELATEGLPVAV